MDHPFAWADVDLPVLQRGAMMGRLVAKVSTGVFFYKPLFHRKEPIMGGLEILIAILSLVAVLARYGAM
jgi:hypothetical protein